MSGPQRQDRVLGDERPQTRPVLELEGLSVVYRTEAGEIAPVRDVSFTVRQGESFGLVGESGSGKSTLAMGAIRYLPSNGRVTAGRVLLNGENLLELSDAELRRLWGAQIGVVYQSPGNALNPSIVVGRQIAEVAQLHLGMNRQQAWQRMLEMLEKVKMPDPESVARRYPHQLSGGMLQRCVVAQALMTNPALLIMDEPTTALDVTTQAVVLDLVAELKTEFDSAILYITHDLGVVARVCDRIGVMYAGEFMELGAIRRLFKRPLHPYTLNLLGCVPHFRPGPRRKQLTTIPGYIPRLDELPEGCIFAPRCQFAEDACRVAQPPMMQAVEDHWTACRRWPLVPSPAEHMASERSELMEEREEQGRILLEARDVKKYYPQPSQGPFGRDKRPVKSVDGMTLWIDAGRTLGLVGESGSGKTTIARTIVGLTPPTEGTIKLEGQELGSTTRERSRQVLRRIQMVFQNPDASLNPRHTVGEAIGRPLALFGTPRREIPDRVLELLKAVHLSPAYYHRLPSELSGGEKQRVAIARAFAADPDLVLCDEPIASLDVSVQGSLMNLLTGLQEEKGTSYLFISHDLAAVQHLSDWVCVAYLGYVMEWGDAREVLRPPYHPYTEALLSAIPVPDPDLEQKNIRLEGSVPSAVDIPSGCRFHTRCPRFIGDICVEEEPPWREGEGDHWIYCHHPLDDLSEMQKDTLRFREGGQDDVSGSTSTGPTSTGPTSSGGGSS
ncbi:MAG: dipeptide ABC transporter ATP-binding protein [Thermoleophilia bacterium]